MFPGHSCHSWGVPGGFPMFPGGFPMFPGGFPMFPGHSRHSWGVPGGFPMFLGCSRCSRGIPDIPGGFPMFLGHSRCSRGIPDVPGGFPMFPGDSRCSWGVPDIPGAFPPFPGDSWHSWRAPGAFPAILRSSEPSRGSPVHPKEFPSIQGLSFPPIPGNSWIIPCGCSPIPAHPREFLDHSRQVFSHSCPSQGIPGSFQAGVLPFPPIPGNSRIIPGRCSPIPTHPREFLDHSVGVFSHSRPSQGIPGSFQAGVLPFLPIPGNSWIIPGRCSPIPTIPREFPDHSRQVFSHSHHSQGIPGSFQAGVLPFLPIPGNSRIIPGRCSPIPAHPREFLGHSRQVFSHSCPSQGIPGSFQAGVLPFPPIPGNSWIILWGCSPIPAHPREFLDHSRQVFSHSCPSQGIPGSFQAGVLPFPPIPGNSRIIPGRCSPIPAHPREFPDHSRQVFSHSRPSQGIPGSFCGGVLPFPPIPGNSRIIPGRCSPIPAHPREFLDHSRQVFSHSCPSQGIPGSFQAGVLPFLPIPGNSRIIPGRCSPIPAHPREFPDHSRQVFSHSRPSQGIPGSFQAGVLPFPPIPGNSWIILWGCSPIPAHPREFPDHSRQVFSHSRPSQGIPGSFQAGVLPFLPIPGNSWIIPGRCSPIPAHPREFLVHSVGVFSHSCPSQGIPGSFQAGVLPFPPIPGNSWIIPGRCSPIPAHPREFLDHSRQVFSHSRPSQGIPGSFCEGVLPFPPIPGNSRIIPGRCSPIPGRLRL
ncbi:uncharacterized protein LOC131590303 [Poecile atricapillus]|uniref:uncharacterized protein LOC131590303 n=1 Tax=Poecile atricapillus TaxID=48891 RepID=UPI0027399B31|nr:uncharacterized protein LOC131590303 [Poecile atricapillus]